MLSVHEGVLVLDFGSQYAHLIARRIREHRVYSEIVPFNTPADEIDCRKPLGIILSGGPSSVYEQSALFPDVKIFQLGIPILGICYGLQLITHLLGGKVEQVEKKEYGKAKLIIDDRKDLFKGLKKSIVAWMSHGDGIAKAPDGFELLAHTSNSPAAAIGDRRRQIYGVQFHPEVAHTPKGSMILDNFLFTICKGLPRWTMESFVERKLKYIRSLVKEERVLCALSGGVDSAAAALLLYNAIGDHLTCIFVDHGLLRKGEAAEIHKIFHNHLRMKIVSVDASKCFLERLKGISDPEEKRKIIGEGFAAVFTEESVRNGPFQWLAQGTLYPDVIESSMSGGPSSLIKTHHNVAGLPDWFGLRILEPLRDLYKDEVREVASLLCLPEVVIKRHPFPGPGLAVRIIGEVTTEKIKISREASWILEQELKKAGYYNKVWQAFAFVGDDKAVGVLGDERRHGYIVTLRVIRSVDAMTADWFRMPFRLLEKISNRITNEISGVTWVTYAVSSKPPATIEPQ